MLRMTPKTAALNQAPEAYGGATSPLNVFPAVGGNRGVGLHANGAGADGHRRLRLQRVLASLGNERGVHLDIVHLPGPDQQRIRRIRGALITVASALDRQAQIIFAGEINRRRDVLGVSGRHCINAGLGSPRIDPSEALGESRLIADKIGIFEVLPELLSRRARWVSFGLG